MAEVTNELMLENLKANQDKLSKLESGQRGMKDEMIAIRLHQHASQGEINSIYSRLGSLDVCLERVDNRLDIVIEPAEQATKC